MRVQSHLEFVRRKELQVKLSMDRELLALPNHWFPPLAHYLAWKPLNYKIIEPWNGLEGTLKVTSSLSFQLFLLNTYIHTQREKETLTGMLCSGEMQSRTQTWFLRLSELTWLSPPRLSVPRAAWSPWMSHGQRTHSATALSDLKGRKKKGNIKGGRREGRKKAEYQSSNSGLLKNANCRTWHCLFIYLIWNRWQYKGALDSWAFVCLQPSCLISFPSLHKDSNLSAKASFIVKRWGSESRGTSRAFK